jgi:hypothetical protein
MQITIGSDVKLGTGEVGRVVRVVTRNGARFYALRQWVRMAWGPVLTRGRLFVAASEIVAVRPVVTPPSAARPALRPDSIRAQLLAAGLTTADRITRNPRTGVVTVHFTDPAAGSFYTKGLEPARVYAERITQAFGNVRVIDTCDSVAEWRPRQPILFGFVALVLEPAEAPAEAIRQDLDVVAAAPASVA